MKRTTNRGFTLLEIMIVVVIIGILGAMVVPQLFGRDDQARAVAASTDLTSIASALEMYKLDNFRYPSTDQGLEALVTRPSGFPEPENYPLKGYVRSLPVDPWGNPYVYLNDGSAYSLYSYGADGTEGGEGMDADILLEDV